jgi:hypothetical protein
MKILTERVSVEAMFQKGGPRFPGDEVLDRDSSAA